MIETITPSIELTPARIALVAVLSFVGYTICTIVYNLTLHPLAKYPGPFLAKITRWYDAYYCHVKTRHIDQQRCQKKYGSVFRYAPNTLVIQTADGLKQIYAGAKTNPVRKSNAYKQIHDAGATSTHSAIDKDSHAFKRRVLSHAFSEQALRNLESLMIGTIDQWAVTLEEGASEGRKGWSTPKNMANYANYVTFDVLGDLCFGRPFGLISSEELRDVPKLMLVRAKQLIEFGNSPVGPLYKWLQEHTPFDRYFRPTMFESMTRFRAFAQKALGDRFAMQANIKEKGEEPRKDFVHYLSQARDPETGMGYAQTEFLTELRLLIIAGSDTSSVVMAGAFFYLVRNPETLTRLQRELRDTFSSADEISSGSKLASCHYLRAVIDEALRLVPPVLSHLPRVVESPGITIDGHFIPAGTEVGTAAFGMHRSPEYFNDPLAFKPERWLRAETPQEEIEVAKKAFAPFSLGIRGCIGKPMAYSELSIALGRVFWQYDVRLKEGDTTGQDAEGMYELKDVFVSERNGPMCEFRRHQQ